MANALYDNRSNHRYLAGRLAAGIIGGFIIAFLAANICTALFGNPLAETPQKGAAAISPIVFLGAWMVSIIIGLKAERAAKAWRRILISSALLSFVIPLTGLIMIIRAVEHLGGNGMIFGKAITSEPGQSFLILISFFSFSIGVIFLTIGLLVGRDK